MAISKTERVLLASTSNGIGTTTFSSSLDVRTTGGGILCFRITNGATGPTAGALVGLQTSSDDADWFTAPEARAGNGNNEVSEFLIDVSHKMMYIRGKISGNTGQAVTAYVVFQELTSPS